VNKCIKCLSISVYIYCACFSLENAKQYEKINSCISKVRSFCLHTRALQTKLRPCLCSSIHLAARNMQLDRARCFGYWPFTLVNGQNPKQNQVAKVAILGGWDDFGRSSVSSPKPSAEYHLCEDVVNKHLAQGTSTLLSFHVRTKGRLCEKAALHFWRNL
jgi:hypothetical protein